MKNGASIFVLAFAGALACAVAPLHAAQWSALRMHRMMAASFDAGDKHVVGYYLDHGGVCKLTLMIGETARDGDDEQTTKPSRLLVTINPGASANFDTVEGKTLSFSCGEDARSMSVAELDHLALNLWTE